MPDLKIEPKQPSSALQALHECGTFTSISQASFLTHKIVGSEILYQQAWNGKFLWSKLQRSTRGDSETQLYMFSFSFTNFFHPL